MPVSSPVILVALTQLAAASVDEIRITARHLPPPPGEAAYAVTNFSSQDLEQSPQQRLDEILTAQSGMSLFRRASSLSAHPTTQGATLRGLGPNGAGRALVLLDGVPMNDPFGNWVMWSALPKNAINGVKLYHGGGAGPFGQGALSGVISLKGWDNFQSHNNIAVMADQLPSLSGDVAISRVVGRMAVAAQFSGFVSDGFFIVPQNQRGPIDVPASSDAVTARLGADMLVGENGRLSARFSFSHEYRVNGITIAENETDAIDASLAYRHQGEELQALIAVYVQDRSFASRFASVDDARATARLVLDQFAVPAQGYGARGELRINWNDLQVTQLLGDLRWTTGETNENFRNLGQGFTRHRQAGGDQFTGGVALEHAVVIEPFTFTAGLRGDYWLNEGGFRRESDRQNNTALLDIDFSERDDWRMSLRGGIAYRVTDALTLRVAGYTGWRLPSLNELYRPFRVGNDITEANENLRPERLKGWEMGLQYNPIASVEFVTTFFANRLEDAIGNITIAQGPGVFPIAGFVPAGGSLRQRENIERLAVRGVETRFTLNLSNGVTFNAAYQFADAEIAKDSMITELAGKRLAQVPRHAGHMALSWQADEDLTATLHLRGSSAQFDDDLNSRRLGGYIAADAGLHYRLNDKMHLSLEGENIFGTDIESAISGDGLLTLATPRRVALGLRYRL